jgi:hypothetical protein
MGFVGFEARGRRGSSIGSLNGTDTGFIFFDQRFLSDANVASPSFFVNLSFKVAATQFACILV